MKSIFIALLLSSPTLLFAQTGERPLRRTTQTLNLTLSAGNGFSVAPYYSHNLKLGKKGRIEVGLGARLTSFFASDKHFITAPAKLTSGKTGPAVLFTENITANIDSVFIPGANTNSLNLTLELGYNLSPKLYAGFNIDLIGFSVGKKFNNGTYIKDGNETGNIEGKPTGFNALLISDNDLGSLNSALTLRYKLNNAIGIYGGVSFIFSEYTTNTEIQQSPHANDRFRYKSLAPALGVSWFFNE